MKFIALFVLCVAVVNAELSKEFQEKVMKEVIEAGKKCMKQENANEDDIKEIMARKNPTRKEGKCLLYCFNREFGAQEEDGSFTKEGLTKSMEPYKAEDENLYNKFVTLLVDVCMPQVKSTDRCEAAAEMDRCYHDNADDELKKADIIF